jgi:colanic acid biosynthesis glycosyl transferase WcaI
MRILVVTQYFWPENFRINDLCEELSKRGHHVTVLTGMPNYPSGQLFEEFAKNPKSFDDYKGSEIVRVPIICRGTGRGFRLVMNYVSYVFSASLLGIWKIRNKSFDVVFVYEPSPVTVCLPAIFYKKRYRVPVVFWVLDLWPETLQSIGVVNSKRILTLIGKLVSYIYNNCDLVLGQSKAFYDGIAKYCHNPSKIKYFPSWSEEIFSGNHSQTKIQLSGGKSVFKVLFAGNIGEAQDFESVLRAAAVLKSKQASAQLFIVGDGRQFEWVKGQVDKRDLVEYIHLLGRHPLEHMPSFYEAADALLVSLKESDVFSMTIPGKIQTYMSAGKPIVSMLTGEGSRVIDEAGCGLTSVSGDYQSLAENIINLSAMSPGELKILGNRAREYSQKEFDRLRLIHQLERWFEEVKMANGS